MTRRGVISLLFQRRDLPAEEFYERALAHDKAFDVFIRKLFGCSPTGDISADTCKAGQREIDYRAYNQAKKTAAKLFSLREE